MRKAWLSSLCLMLILSFVVSVKEVGAAANEVTPIAWSTFTAAAPTDADTARIRSILVNSNKYALTEWYPTVKNYDAQTGTYLSFGGTAEDNIRPSASEAIALAASLKLGAYDAAVTGVSVSSATAIANKLISSLAYQHAANTSGGWGNHWQSALWASLAGTAGWLMWDDLSVTDREYVRKMVEYEANRFNTYTVPYYRNASGTIVIAGDSKGEENSWNAMILQLATSMMPNHPNYLTWMNKNVELMLSAFARPSDVTNNTIINGKSVATWIKGSNINEDGTMVNHNIIHPDYMATAIQNGNAALLYTLAGKATPSAALFNLDIVYDTMVDLNFTAGTNIPPGGTVAAPGGTIFVDGGSDIYYPQGNDWGIGRRMNFAHLDAQARALGYDTLASQKGAYWEPYHAQKVLDMQTRYTDGHTYSGNSEDTYGGREEWVAQHAGRAFLTKWISAQNKYTLTNEAPSMEIIVDNSDGGVTKSSGWLSSSTSSLRIGSDYLQDGNTNKGALNATFTPVLPVTGTYSVYVYYNAAANRANNVPFTITHASGTASVGVNQQINGGTWVQLGTYTFNSGSTGSVTISNTGTSGYVIADAVKFVKQ
ncbi:golvesin C-terminal-like domain-containing protein [Paenibacillus roseipurpureus]|uniref:Golvesin/Xly CBD-like domain-containing protein n=1 Tax=Paenibacillus roseopurpureus TaxID=2918901 RepID=A0AA96LU13_9BACL|nr:hypothetical protein [Paenibacillus sp. MBLB1832]WNR46033.1 hypothetical protein MJB10_08050 [Paenibacillus sp. MBLB1832]